MNAELFQGWSWAALEPRDATTEATLLAVAMKPLLRAAGAFAGPRPGD